MLFPIVGRQFLEQSVRCFQAIATWKLLFDQLECRIQTIERHQSTLPFHDSRAETEKVAITIDCQVDDVWLVRQPRRKAFSLCKEALRGYGLAVVKGYGPVYRAIDDGVGFRVVQRVVASNKGNLDSAID